MRKHFAVRRCHGTGRQIVVSHGAASIGTGIIVSVLLVIDFRALPLLGSCSAVGIEMYDKRILTRESDNIDPACDIFPRNRKLSGLKVQRVVILIQHLPANLDMGTDGRRRDKLEGQLVPVDRNQGCVIIFAPLRIRTADNRRPFRSDRECVFIGNAVPLCINHGFGADRRRKKVKCFGVGLRADSPADEAIVRVFRHGIRRSLDRIVGGHIEIPANLGRRRGFFGKFLSVGVKCHVIEFHGTIALNYPRIETVFRKIFVVHIGLIGSRSDTVILISPLGTCFREFVY